MRSFASSVKNFLFLIVFIFSGLAFVTIVNGVVAGSELEPFNHAVETAISPLRVHVLTTIMLFITNIGSPFVLSMVAVLCAIVILLHRDTYDALLFLCSISLSIVLFTILKNYFVLPRPTGGIISPSGYSFPSGHATVSTAFFFTVGYSFFDWMKGAAGKVTLVLVCIISAALISFSRVYLGAHYALDVLGGISLGLLCVSFTALVFNIFLDEKMFWKKSHLL